MAGRRSTTIGDAGESRALAFLCQRGLRLLERNFRCRAGEIDLVMQEGETLVFVEVRHRQYALYGTAAESITVHKRRKLLRAASVYVAWHPKWRDRSVRFDLVTLDGAPPSISWLPAAINSE